MLFKGKPSGDLQLRVEYQGPPVNLGGQNIQNQGQQWPQGQPAQQGQPGQQGQQGWGQQGQQGANNPPQGNQGGWGQQQPPKQDGPGFIM